MEIPSPRFAGTHYSMNHHDSNRTSQQISSSSSKKPTRKTSTQRLSNNIYCLCILVTFTIIAVGIIGTTEAATTNGRRTPQISQQPSTNKNAKPKRMHPAFANAGRKAGLEIWRVESFEPVPVPAKDFGKFFTGDSYIVLNTQEFKGKFNWDIHFWLGSQTSQDESGAAAILSVELDDHLGGGPIQHRETQEHESQKFISYFKGGVRYQSGGVQSGFTHVDPNAFEKRMYQVKGKRNVRVREVAPNLSSMNKGDCFILDLSRDIYVYVGKNAKRMERLKAITAANQIRDQDHAGRSKVHIIDEFSTEDEVEQFFTGLGSGNRDAVPDESTSSDDETYENTNEGVTLYRVSDASGSTKYEKVNDKPLKQASLNTNDCFYLDTVSSGIYAWIGKKCSERERKDVMAKAANYIKEKNYPAWISVKRIIEGAEPIAFKQYFQMWKDRGEINSRILKRSINFDDEEDVQTLRSVKKSGKIPNFMPDNGDGETEIYRVENFELVPIEESQKGTFYSGDSYIIKYTYDSEFGQKYIIYYWQGNSSSQDERASSALHAVRLDNELNGKAIQIRVTENNEPRHFLHVFKGKMVVLMGGKASGFKNINDKDTFDEDGTRLFRIRGTSEENVRAVQFPEVAASLNSDDVFILETAGKSYIWYGSGANSFERSMASNIIHDLTPANDSIEIAEGEEPDDFWTALGGKGDYDHEAESKIDEENVRLIHCHLSKRGKLKVEEIDDFTQEDLDEDDIMILDTGDEIYIWIGNESSNEEKVQVMKMAKDYMKRTNDERAHKHDVIVTVKQGEEPESFKELFPDWKPELWNEKMTYAQYKQQVEDRNNIIED